MCPRLSRRCATRGLAQHSVQPTAQRLSGLCGPAGDRCRRQSRLWGVKLACCIVYSAAVQPEGALAAQQRSPAVAGGRPSLPSRALSSLAARTSRVPGIRLKKEKEKAILACRAISDLWVPLKVAYILTVL